MRPISQGDIVDLYYQSPPEWFASVSPVPIRVEVLHIPADVGDYYHFKTVYTGLMFSQNPMDPNLCQLILHKEAEELPF